MGLRGRVKRMAPGVGLAALSGAAAAAAAAAVSLSPPVLAHSVNVAPVTGKVTVTVPGHSRALLTSPEQIPVGSLIDASAGAVDVTAADAAGNPPYSGRFSRGTFQIRQSASGGGVTQIVLEGACTKAAATSAGPLAASAKAPKPHIRRYLLITANGKFVIVAVNGTATASGPASWIVNDNCDGTTSVVDRQGQVGEVSRAGSVVHLGPGQRGRLYCQPSHGALRYCQLVISDPPSNVGHFELALFHRHAKNFTVCLVRAGRTARCQVGAFKPETKGRQDTALICTLNTLPRGTYQARFLVEGKQVGIALPWTTNHASSLIPGLGSYCNTFTY